MRLSPLVLSVFLVWTARAFAQQPEPMYEGKSTQEWLALLKNKKSEPRLSTLAGLARLGPKAD